jgi:flagella basal body P-ring formation protein FlgA
LVDSDVIRLSELCQIQTDDTHLRAALEATTLGQAPQPGLKRTFSRESLLSRISSQGIDVSKVNWIVPPLVTVARDYQVLEHEMALKAVEEFLRRNFPQKNSQVLIKQLRLPKTFLPKGAVELRVAPSARFKAQERSHLSLDVHVDNKRIKSCLVEVDAQFWADVPVAQRDIKRGEPLTPEAFRMERRDLAAEPVDVVTMLDALKDKIVRVDIPHGTSVAERALDRPRMVTRGDVVTLMAQNGSFRVSTKAKAQASGKLGDVISVVNIDSGKSVYAEVRGYREVQVR